MSNRLEQPLSRHSAQFSRTDIDRKHHWEQAGQSQETRAQTRAHACVRAYCGRVVVRRARDDAQTDHNATRVAGVPVSGEPVLLPVRSAWQWRAVSSE